MLAICFLEELFTSASNAMFPIMSPPTVGSNMPALTRDRRNVISAPLNASLLLTCVNIACGDDVSIAKAAAGRIELG